MVPYNTNIAEDKLEETPYYEGGTGYTQEDIDRMKTYFGEEFNEESMKALIEQMRLAKSGSSKGFPGVTNSSPMKRKEKNKREKQKVQKASRKRNRR